MNIHYKTEPSGNPSFFNVTKNMRRIFAVLFVAVSLWACNDDDDKPQGKYEHGAFVLNEGKFLSGTGTITYYNETADTLQQNIFRNAAGQYAGDVVQSMIFHDDKAYIVVNGDNKVEIANANTFERLGSITDDQIIQPRYMEVVDNKGYLTVQGPYDDNYNLVDSYVLVIDLSNNTVTKKIPTEEGIENIVYVGNKLFVGASGYSSNHNVGVIDPSNNTLVDNIELDGVPVGMVVDNNNKLWVLANGDADAKLYRINPSTFEKEQTINLGTSVDTDLAITPDKSGLIYSASGSFYKISTSATTASTTPLFSAEEIITQYAMNVDPDNGEIWIGDALNYSSEGKVYIYTSDGKLKKTFTAGISPTNFVFR
ncbi:hypothetical protein D4L85_11880 [Chryseolinea soli]|uniref:YncE family protein n=2 Tax=Chryseolinea soli TaxID=2321403 RepID=A0A385SMS0_9BACT|nr:hypothetical protein D4L85_11880 [Chryseolinea soli]